MSGMSAKQVESFSFLGSRDVLLVHDPNARLVIP